MTNYIEKEEGECRSINDNNSTILCNLLIPCVDRNYSPRAREEEDASTSA